MYYYQLLLYITVILVIIIVIIVITTIEWYWMTTMDILSFHVIFAPCVLLYTVMHVAAWCCMYSIHVRNELRVVLCEGPARARTPWKMDKLEGTAERTHRSVWFSMVQCRTVPRIRNFPLLGCGHLQSRARFRLGKVNNIGITWNHKTCFEMFSTYFNISMIFMLCVTMIFSDLQLACADAESNQSELSSTLQVI